MPIPNINIATGEHSVRKSRHVVLTLKSTAILMLIATLLTVVQVTFVLAWARPGKSVSEKYFALNQHDSQWYGHIAENGYRLRSFPLENKSNVMAQIGFFPGYPVLVAGIQKLSGISTALALLLTAQFFTIGMWTYVLMFFRRYRVGWKFQVASIVAVMAFPSGFFLVCGYSESLFTFSLLGYLYWMTDDHPYAWIPASIHGFIMSATRIVGIPLLVLPFLRHYLKDRSLTPSIAATVIALSTGLGAGAFFLYCQSQFGEWNVYSHAQSFGWGVMPHYTAMLDSSIYKIVMPAVSFNGYFNPDDTSRLSIPLMLTLVCILFSAHVIAVLKNPRNRFKIDRIIFSVAIGCLLFVTVSGLYAVGMRSVIRYMLPPFILLVIMAASMFSEDKATSIWSTRFLWCLFSIVMAIFFYVEAGFIVLHSYGRWVA